MYKYLNISKLHKYDHTGNEEDHTHTEASHTCREEDYIKIM